MSNGNRAVLIALVWIGLASAGALAQDGPPPPAAAAGDSAELREAMQSFFEKRVRAELGLTDEQFAALIPRVREMEQSRVEFRQQRMNAVRQLQRGLREGAADRELLDGLAALQRIDDEARAEELRLQAGIDGGLTARQQVQYRFFTQRFRSEIDRRIRGMRDRPGARREEPQGQRSRDRD